MITSGASHPIAEMTMQAFINTCLEVREAGGNGWALAGVSHLIAEFFMQSFINTCMEAGEAGGNWWELVGTSGNITHHSRIDAEAFMKTQLKRGGVG